MDIQGDLLMVRAAWLEGVRLTAWSVGGMALILIWYAVFTPVHLVLDHDADTRVSATSADSVIRLARARTNLVSLALVQVITEGPGSVEMALPVVAGRRLRFDQLNAVTGAWVQTYGGERIESNVAGSAVSFVLPIGNDTELPFLQRSDGGKVSVEYSGIIRHVDLRSAPYAWKPLRLNGAAVRSIATVSPLHMLRGVDVSFSGGDLAQASGLWRIGTKDVIGQFKGVPRNGHVALRASVVTLGKGMQEGFIELLKILLMSISTLLAATAIGGGVARITGLAGRHRICWLTALAMGGSLFALVVNSLSYVLALENVNAVLWIVAIGLAGLGAPAVLPKPSALLGGAAIPSVKPPWPVWLAISVGVWLVFWPLVFVGSQSYLGFLQTDSFFYTNVSDQIRAHALKDLVDRGGIIGYGMRSLDLSLAAALSSMSGAGASTIWLTLVGAGLLVPPLAAYYVVLEWMGTRIAAITSVAVALSAPLAGLFFESYLAQYLLTTVLYLNIHVGQRFLHEMRESSPTLGGMLPLAAVSTVAILLYPYFSIVTAVVVFYGAWLGRGQPRALLRSGVLLAALVLAFGNLGFYFLANPDAAGGFSVKLNEIAKHTVFPFYADAKFPAFLLGIVPFHGDGEFFSALAGMNNNAYVMLLGDMFYFASPSVLVGLVLTVACVYGAALVRYRHQLLDRFGLLLVLCLLTYIVTMALAYHYSGLYAYAKLAWTLATLLPLIVVPVFALAALPENAQTRANAAERMGRGS